MILQDNPGCSSTRAVPDVHAVGAHLLSPSHTCLLSGDERSHREAAVLSLSMISFLTLIHPLPKANESGPFVGTWCQALLILSVSPALHQGCRLHSVRGGPALQGRSALGTTSLATRAPWQRRGAVLQMTALQLH